MRAPTDNHDATETRTVSVVLQEDDIANVAGDVAREGRSTFCTAANTSVSGDKSALQSGLLTQQRRRLVSVRGA